MHCKTFHTSTWVYNTELSSGAKSQMSKLYTAEPVGPTFQKSNYHTEVTNLTNDEHTLYYFTHAAVIGQTVAIRI